MTSKKPSFTVVGSGPTSPRPSFTAPKPPRKLGEHGMKLWRDVHADYPIDDVGGIELLAQACASLDRAEELAACIAEHGAVTYVKGCPKAHPAVRDELACRGFVVRTLQRRGLNVEQVKSPGRPGKSIGLTWDKIKDREGWGPIARRGEQRGTPSTPRAVDLVKQIIKLPPQCTCVITSPLGCNDKMDCPSCRRWWDLHSELHDELRLTPAQWPAIVHPLSAHALDALAALAPDEYLDKSITPHHRPSWRGGRELYDELMRLAS